MGEVEEGRLFVMEPTSSAHTQIRSLCEAGFDFAATVCVCVCVCTRVCLNENFPMLVCGLAHLIML